MINLYLQPFFTTDCTEATEVIIDFRSVFIRVLRGELLFHIFSN